MNNFDDLKLATEGMTGGKNTVLLDDVGMPSIMVVIPKMMSSDLVVGATDEAHPAFIVDGVEKDKVYISKYLNIVQNNRGYSLPMQNPRINVAFDNALAYCRNKGEGWGLTPASLWGAIALWCKKNGTQPHGNNSYGTDSTYNFEKGVSVYTDTSGRTNRTATGSGPVTWAHDFTLAGICDLNGNINEWNAGARLIAGALQIIPYANCMLPKCDMGAESTEWKYIDLDGSYTSDSNDNYIHLDYNSSDSKFYWSDGISSRSDAATSTGFANLTTDENVEDSAKILLRKLALLPENDDDDYGRDTLWAHNSPDETILCRGGAWTSTSGAGVFYSHLGYTRTTATNSIGFRSVYYEL